MVLNVIESQPESDQESQSISRVSVFPLIPMPHLDLGIKPLAIGGVLAQMMKPSLAISSAFSEMTRFPAISSAFSEMTRFPAISSAFSEMTQFPGTFAVFSETNAHLEAFKEVMEKLRRTPEEIAEGERNIELATCLMNLIQKNHWLNLGARYFRILDRLKHTDVQNTDEFESLSEALEALEAAMAIEQLELTLKAIADATEPLIQDDEFSEYANVVDLIPPPPHIVAKSSPLAPHQPTIAA